MVDSEGGVERREGPGPGTTQQGAPGPGSEDKASLKDFYADMKEVDRENEVMRVLGAFKLNPYEMLGLRFDVDPGEIPRTYRKISLAVHPDKCSHPKANEAFEIIGHAHKELMDPDKKSGLDTVLNTAKGYVVKEWKKSAKNDAASQLAVALHGIDSVMDTWMKTDAFHEAWKAKSRELLAKTEWRKRKLTQRIEEETGRAEEEARKKRKEILENREKQKKWEDGREERMDSWRSFATGGGLSQKKKKKKKEKTTADGETTAGRRGNTTLPKLFKPPKPKV